MKKKYIKKKKCEKEKQSPYQLKQQKKSILWSGVKKLTTAKDLTLHLIELIKPTDDMINNIANSRSNFGRHNVTDLPL